MLNRTTADGSDLARSGTRTSAAGNGFAMGTVWLRRAFGGPMGYRRKERGI